MASRPSLLWPIATYLHPPDWSQRPSTAVAILVGGTVLVAAAFALVGQTVAATVDGTVVVENPAYPGDVICEHGSSSTVPSGCAEPQTIERTYATVVVEGFRRIGFHGSVLLLGGFLFALVDVHLGAAWRDGDGSVLDTVGVTAWATLPWALALSAIAPLAGYAVASGAAVPPEAGFGSLGSVLGGLALPGVAVLVAAAVSSWLACYAGLRRVHGLSDFWATRTTLGIAAASLVIAFAILGL